MSGLGRVVCLVADSLGVGATPDAGKYGDTGANTLAHTCDSVGGLKLPNLEKLGLGGMGNFSGVKKADRPLALISRLAEASAGKDTTTGHWEIAGTVTRKAYATFPDGFPKDLVEEFVREAGIPGVLGNCAASGTQIIEELGEGHIKTGKPILYTSADSVFQIAAHEKHFGLERLYKICEIARKLTLPRFIGRVIARPFVGEDSKSFKRTENRRDYSMDPPTTSLDVLTENGIAVYGVGKIEDIFNHRGISHSNHTGNNADSLNATVTYLKETENQKAFIFTNLVDFDMLYGHRRDPKGYAKALSDLDTFLPKILKELKPEDLLIITGDHGCDPTYRGSDHTREFVPLVAYRPGASGAYLPDRSSFADISASILKGYGITTNKLPDLGKSFI